MTSYSPYRSTVTDETLVKFLQDDLKFDLETVPGIGPKAREILESNTIRNTFQLVAAFLNLKTTDGHDCVDHCSRFYEFLSDAGVKGNRHSIVKSIAEKCAISFPKLYTESQFSHMQEMETEC